MTLNDDISQSFGTY